MQKTFPQGDVLHTYLVHPPGGLVGGDEVACEAHFHSSSRALLTTPAAGKIYRTPHTGSRFAAHLKGHDQSHAFWLPQENIVFQGAHHHSTLSCHLSKLASLSLWDIACLGRPGCNESFADGRLLNTLEIFREREPLLLERALWPGGSPHLTSAWGAAQQTVVGSLVLAWPQWPDLTAALGDLSRDQVQAGGSFRNGIYILRARGPCAHNMRQLFLEVLESLLPKSFGQSSFSRPRIWAY